MWALLSLRSRTTGIALWPHRPHNTLRPLFAYRSLFSDRPTIPFFSTIPFWANRAHGSRITFGAHRPPVAFWANWPRITLDSLDTHGARFSFGAYITPYSLRPLRSCRAGASSWANWSRTARLSLNAPWADRPTITFGARRPHRPLGPLDCDHCFICIAGTITVTVLIIIAEIIHSIDLPKIKLFLAIYMVLEAEATVCIPSGCCWTSAIGA